MTLEVSTINVIISGVLAALNGWLMMFVKSQSARITAANHKNAELELDIAKLRGELNVEIAERRGMSADITRVEDKIDGANAKLDTLIQSLSDSYIPRREFDARLNALEQRPINTIIKN